MDATPYKLESHAVHHKEKVTFLTSIQTINEVTGLLLIYPAYKDIKCDRKYQDNEEKCDCEYQGKFVSKSETK